MFTRSFRSDHEFMSQEEMELFQRRLACSATSEELFAWVRERDAAKPLDLDSSGAHFGLVDILAEAFPEAKFILTLRNIYSWMNSCVGKLYGDFVGGWGSPAGVLVNCMRFLPDGQFAMEDRANAKVCLEQLMKAWTAVNERILKLVPADRLLVVNTERLSESIGLIADFCGIDANLIDAQHANPGQASDFLSCFDSEGVEKLVRLHCWELMGRYYPGMTLSSHVARHRPGTPVDCGEMSRYFALDRFVPTEFVQTRFPVADPAPLPM
jgi:hypothetical protein